MLPEDYKHKGGLIVPSHIKPQLVFPGIRGKIKIDVLNKNSGEVAPVIKKGTTAIIQPLNKDKLDEPQVYNIIPYEPDAPENSDLPESRREIKLHLDKAKKIKVIANPHHIFQWSEEQYQRSSADLFADGQPRIEDINQGLIPNCFLLAAITAVLSKEGGDSFIRQMMRQNDDGTTTVRLFDPNTLKPVYIRVETSYLIDAEYNALNHHEGLWVDILEKAAACKPEFFGKEIASVSSTLQGGQSKIALSILTGCSNSDAHISFASSFAWDSDEELGAILKSLSNQRKILENLDDAEEDEDEEESIDIKEYMLNNAINGAIEGKLRFSNIFGLQWREDAKRLLSCYLKNETVWSEQYKKHNTPESRLMAIITHFESIVEQEESPVSEADISVLKSMYNYYHKPDDQGRRRDNNQLFSGNYSPEESQIFDDIKKHLENDEAVTASTLPKNEFPKDGLGLRAQHAYTILNVIEKHHEDGKTVKMIRLRNPWGRVGRIYLPDEDQPENKQRTAEYGGADTFDLELKDFCKYFIEYQYTLDFCRTLEQSKEFTEKLEQFDRTLKQKINFENFNNRQALSDYVAHYNQLTDEFLTFITDDLQKDNEDILDQLYHGLNSKDEEHLKELILNNYSALCKSNNPFLNPEMISLLIHYHSSEPLEKAHWKVQCIDQLKEQLPALEKYADNRQVAQAILDYGEAKTHENMFYALSLVESLIKANTELSPYVLEDNALALPFYLQTRLIERHIEVIKEYQKSLPEFLHEARIKKIEQQQQLFKGVVEKLKGDKDVTNELDLIDVEFEESDLGLKEQTEKAKRVLEEMMDKININTYFESSQEPTSKTFYESIKSTLKSAIDVITDWLTHFNSNTYERRTTNTDKYRNYSANGSRLSMFITTPIRGDSFESDNDNDDKYSI